MEGKLQYKISNDINGNPLNGSKNYKLHLPADMPTANFWSIIVYDIQTQLIITTSQAWPSVHSNRKKLVLNTDGSVDVWFGPEAPEDKENNWVKTIHGKEWYLILRLYDLPEPMPELLWKPDEIEALD